MQELLQRGGGAEGVLGCQNEAAHGYGEWSVRMHANTTVANVRCYLYLMRTCTNTQKEVVPKSHKEVVPDPQDLGASALSPSTRCVCVCVCVCLCIISMRDYVYVRVCVCSKALKMVRTRACACMKCMGVYEMHGHVITCMFVCTRARVRMSRPTTKYVCLHE